MDKKDNMPSIEELSKMGFFKTDEKSNGDMLWLMSMALLLLNGANKVPPIEDNKILEKEVSYLHGKIDAFEKILK